MIFSWFAAHLGVGGLFSLSFVPPDDFGREFHRFTGVLTTLLLGAGVAGGALEGVLGWGLLGAAVVWVFLTQWGRIAWIRPTLWGLTSLGMIALVMGTPYPARHPLLSPVPWTVAANGLAAAGLLGSASLAMLLGHWYLVIPGLDIIHLRRLTQVLGLVLGVRVLLVGLSISASAPLAGAGGVSPWTVAAVREGFFFWSRVGIGLILPAILTFLVDRTVKIHSTQSATGLLYVVVVLVLIGELLSRFLFVTVAIPQ